MITLNGIVADHFLCSTIMERAGHTYEDVFEPSKYRGQPYLAKCPRAALPWIEENIAHGKVTVIVPASIHVPDAEGCVFLYGWFASDDDAILFKMKWEGAR